MSVKVGEVCGQQDVRPSSSKAHQLEREVEDVGVVGRAGCQSGACERGQGHHEDLDRPHAARSTGITPEALRLGWGRAVRN